jgi:hypothetical protein
VTCALQPSRWSAIPVVGKNFGNGDFFRRQCGHSFRPHQPPSGRSQDSERRHAGSYSSSKLKAAALSPQTVGVSGAGAQGLGLGFECVIACDCYFPACLRRLRAHPR